MKIALIAHDKKKDDIIKLAIKYKDVLKEHRLFATGTTGSLIMAETGLDIIRMKSGPLGGDQQIGSMIADGELDLVIFLRDPLTSQPHEPDVSALMRLCDVRNIPLATNKTSAAIMLKALSDGDTLHVTGGTSITDPGETTNELTVVITDADGNDVTSRYSIVWLYGALRVYANGGSGGGSGGLDTSGGLAGGASQGGDGDAVMLMIKSSVGGTVYLRLMSFGDYIYSGWDKAYEYTDSDLSPLYYATESLIAGGAETATLDVINYANDYVLPYYIASYSSQKGDVTITSSDTGGYSVGYIPGDYLTEPEAFSRIILSGMSAYESYVLSEYLTVPEDTKTQLLSLASEAGISADDPDVINKVAEYIRNAATYDLEYDSAMDEKDDVVVSFLTEYKLSLIHI